MIQERLWPMLDAFWRHLRNILPHMTTLCPSTWGLKAGTTRRNFSMLCEFLCDHSCQIGGNISTNAGGLRLLRYGSLHGSVLGLEVVLPDGTILDNLSTLRKDNTGEITTLINDIRHSSRSGYDLKQLFIGAEGTLGVVTGVSILTPTAPRSVNNVILALPTFENVLPLFKLAQRHLSEILSAFEFIDRAAYELAVKHGQGKGLSDQEIEGAECFVLLETSGGEREHDEEVRVLGTDVESLTKCPRSKETQHPPRNTSRVRSAPDHYWRTLPIPCPVCLPVEVA